MIIHLPSNSSMQYFPNNTIQNYKTKLSNAINLDGEYEVALSEIIAPVIVYNILTEAEGEIYILDSNGGTTTVGIPKGAYPSMRLLLIAINDAINISQGKFVNYIYFSHNDTKLKTSYVIKYRDGITMGTGLHYGPQKFDLVPTNYHLAEMYFIKGLNMSNKLKDILGYIDRLDTDKDVPLHIAFSNHIIIQSDRLLTEHPDSTWPNIDPPESLMAEEISDLHSGEHAFYVYTDIIECTNVGDTFVPLLRIVPIPHIYDMQSRQHQIIYTPKQLQYYKVNTSRLDVITVYITNSMGLKTPFERGHLNVTLRFRRVGDID